MSNESTEYILFNQSDFRNEVNLRKLVGYVSEQACFDTLRDELENLFYGISLEYEQAALEYFSALLQHLFYYIPHKEQLNHHDETYSNYLLTNILEVFPAEKIFYPYNDERCVIWVDMSMGYTAFYQLINEGYFGFAEQLIQPLGNNESAKLLLLHKNANGFTPLGTAVNKNLSRTTATVIEIACNVFWYDAQGFLDFATASCGGGTTFLHYCIRKENYPLLKILLKHFSEYDDEDTLFDIVNTQDNEGNTPLATAMSLALKKQNSRAWEMKLKQVYEKIINTLLEYGADGDILNNNDISTWELFEQYQNERNHSCATNTY